MPPPPGGPAPQGVLRLLWWLLWLPGGASALVHLQHPLPRPVPWDAAVRTVALPAARGMHWVRAVRSVLWRCIAAPCFGVRAALHAASCC